jgi:hypothetical protein
MSIRAGAVTVPAPRPSEADPPGSGAELTLGRAMGWLLGVSSLLWPRAVIVGFWIFGSQLGGAFSSWVIPAIGFFVLPWTTMTYALVWGISADKVSGAEWILVAAAFGLDLLTWAGVRRFFFPKAPPSPAKTVVFLT